MQRCILQPGPSLACLSSPEYPHRLSLSNISSQFPKVIQDKEFCHASPTPAAGSNPTRKNVDYFLPRELSLFEKLKVDGNNSKMPPIHLTMKLLLGGTVER